MNKIPHCRPRNHASMAKNKEHSCDWGVLWFPVNLWSVKYKTLKKKKDVMWLKNTTGHSHICGEEETAQGC